MNDLIEALQIFAKYATPDYPTHCEHDVMYINSDVQKDQMTDDDMVRLEELGFFHNDEFDTFISYRFGSC